MIFRKGGLQVENLEELIKWIVDQEWGNGLIDVLFPDVNLKERKLFLRQYPDGQFHSRRMLRSSPRGQNYFETFALDTDGAPHHLSVEVGNDTDITGRELLRPNSYIRDYMRGAVWYPDGESFDEIQRARFSSKGTESLRSEEVTDPSYRGGLIICLEKSHFSLPSGFRAIDLSEAIDIILPFCRQAPDERLRSYLILGLTNMKITYEHGIEIFSRDREREPLASGYYILSAVESSISRELRGEPGTGSSHADRNIFRARITEGLYPLFRRICAPVISMIPGGEKTVASDSSYWYPLLQKDEETIIFQLFHITSTSRKEYPDDFEDEDRNTTVVYPKGSYWAYNYDICLGITLDFGNVRRRDRQGCIYINDARIENDEDRDRLLTSDIEKLKEKGIFRPIPIRFLSFSEPRIGEMEDRFDLGLGPKEIMYTGLSEVNMDGALFTVSNLYSFFSEMMQRMVDIVLSDPDGDFFSVSGK